MVENAHFNSAVSKHPPDDEDDEFSDNQLLRLPPVGPPSWDSNVVCIQPTRNPSRPEGHEEPEEKQNNNNNNVGLAGGAGHPVVKHLIDFPLHAGSHLCLG